MKLDVFKRTFQKLRTLLKRQDALVATMPRKSKARQLAVQYAAGIKRALRIMATTLRKVKGTNAG